MRTLIQRVSSASVSVNKTTVGLINTGLLVFLGIENEDNDEDIEWLCRKIVNMRIFEDEELKMNNSLLDIQGNILIISQFTLHASTKKGNRPSFIGAAKPQKAKDLYRKFVDHLTALLPQPPQTGVFGEMMQVTIVNEGPVTIWLDSKNKE